ncbi:MAG: polyphosphate kinase 2 [Pseudomonadales bacterium]
MDKADYKPLLRALQIELVKLQRQLIRDERKVLVILEGRDAAGKDGTIKRLVAHMSPRETRVVALGKPTENESRSWFFQRYVPHLPIPMEFTVFNRSWYNRAGVERVMGFCSVDQYVEFMETVVEFERMVVRSGVKLLKYYLDISKDEQRRRLEDRAEDPLSQWKISPVDGCALERWDAYTEARDRMLVETDHQLAPWTIVRADHKRAARVALIADLLSRLPYEGRDESVVAPDRDVVFHFKAEHLETGALSR